MSKRKKEKAAGKALTFTVDLDAIDEINMVGLRNLRCALHLVGEQLSAFGCQPRFLSEPSRASNAPGVMVAELREFIALYEQAIVKAGRDYKPDTVRETEARNWLLVGFEADCRDSMADLSVMVAQAVKDEADAANAERLAEIIGRAA